MTDRDPTTDNSDPQPSTVFFSYSREDQARAVPIIGVIQDAGFTTWWDGLLEGGERFSKATEDALDRAKAVVVLWSRTSVQSHWVRDEATRGRDRGILIPLSLDGCEPPLGFGQFQVINLAQSRIDSSDTEILRMLRAIAASHRAVLSIPIAPVKQSRKIGRRLAIGGGLSVAAAAAGIAIWKGNMLGSPAIRNSVAVLPFDNLSGDPQQRYFSDGLASEIRSNLSRNGLLEIVGQTSSNQFREHSGNARSIAKELNVSFLLDGNVQRVGDRVKIAAELTDGRTGTTQWSRIFERQLADIFAVQSEIATAVAGALSAVMDEGSAGKKALQVGGTKSLAAFDAYLRGRDLFESHIDEASERAALAKLEQAIAIDADYAAARALRSRTLAVIANQYATAVERKALYNEAVSEAQQATRNAPNFAPAYAALGYALFYGRLDAAAARAPYERAHQLAQGDVDVLSRYAVYCARTGRFVAAETAINRAAVLDPLNSSMFKSAGNIKYAAKAYQAAIGFGRKALALSPQRGTLHGDIANAYFMLGDLDKAQAEFALESNSLLALPGDAIIAHRRNDKGKANAALAALIAEHGDNALYQQAQIFAQWGEIEKAFAALDKAYAAADSGLVYLLNDPFLEPLRADTRFIALLRQLKFV
ncbi:TIR domain-containing protein [Sphingorhabdus profundilacus]|uniref:TIR domain-containing protein n=1 Tax=Sphingorhabdus profundilacus TaxID=2509718 RepID=UPI001365BA28|nr:TIR domain-containing protein [Sphingorhabdus profundilacus]